MTYLFAVAPNYRNAYEEEEEEAIIINANSPHPRENKLLSFLFIVRGGEEKVDWMGKRQRSTLGHNLCANLGKTGLVPLSSSGKRENSAAKRKLRNN